MEASVSLREITEETVLEVLSLEVTPEQEQFVAPNSYSLSQALFSKTAWYRAIYLDETPVGFVMVADDTLLSEPPANPEFFIWRFMVDHRYQGRGIGSRALQLVIDHARSRPGVKLVEVSYMPGEGSPEGVYLRAGFQRTDRVDEDELILELPLDE